MEKPFLLLMGPNSYPGRGDQDWQGFFATRQEAIEAGVKIAITFGGLDWVDIIDIREPKETRIVFSVSN